MMIYAQLFDGEIFYDAYYFIGFSLFSIVFVVYFLYKIIDLKEPLKIYFTTGTLFYFMTTIAATMATIFLIEDSPLIIRPIGIYYIGLVVEILIFAFALGLKIESIYKGKLIVEVELQALKDEQNELLKLKVKEKEKELMLVNEKTEEQRINNLAIKFDAEISNLKINALRNQMNPHFIFNSLNSIKLYIINSDKENAVYYLNKFSKLIRFILLGSNKKETTLEEELKFIELYVSIENIRFNNEIDFSIDLADEAEILMTKIPPLILQPYIENAIWHGLSSKKGSKNIQLNIRKDCEDFIMISIIDNGIGRTASAKVKANKMVQSKSVGLNLTLDRLNNFSKDYKLNACVEFIDLLEDGRSKGTQVNIKIPTKKKHPSEL